MCFETSNINCILVLYNVDIFVCLSVSQDQFDTIDFSNNEIRKLDGFPFLHRLRNVIINNNRIRFVVIRSAVIGVVIK